MDPIALKTFVTVARCGSVSGAAEELHTVQSNVTARVKQLESELGVQLFVRHSRGVFPTPAGERLLAFARRFNALDDELRAELRDDDAIRGHLRLGTMETTGAVRLPSVLKRFHGSHPDTQLEVRTGTTADLLEQVLLHKLDGAFVAGPVAHPGLVGSAVFAEELVLVRAAGSLDVDERLREGRLTVIMFRLGCAYRQRMEAAFAEQGWLPYQRLEFGTVEGILGRVEADVGVAVLPRSVVDSLAVRKQLVVESLGHHGLMVDTWFVQRADADRGAVMKAFEAVLC